MTTLLRSLFLVASGVATAAFAPSTALGKQFTLDELVALAKRSNPGLAAGAQQTAAIEAQLSEANRSWLPTGELTSLFAPAPELRCDPDLDIFPKPDDVSAKDWREANCYRTGVSEARLNFGGIFTRTEVRLVQPIFTFGKISAGVSAAKSGVAASKSREAGIAADLELNVKKAYWGAKLAREVLETLDEAMGHVTDAQKKVDEELAAGSGNMTPQDRQRLRAVRAEAQSRVLEARKGAALARNGLRALIGPEAPEEIDVDAEPLAAVNVPPRPIAHYEEQARLSRPEVRALDHLLASKRALADLELRKLYPDLVLMGTARFAYSSAADDPQNAFFDDPWNNKSAGVAAALRLPLDLFVRDSRADRLRAEAEETMHRRRDALGGIAFEVRRAHGELIEAQERAKVALDGEKAGKAWLTGLLQKQALGVAETRDFADALGTYFQWRVKHLQALYDVNLAAAALSRATGGEVVAR